MYEFEQFFLIQTAFYLALWIKTDEMSWIKTMTADEHIHDNLDGNKIWGIIQIRVTVSEMRRNEQNMATVLKLNNGVTTKIWKFKKCYLLLCNNLAF